ncbi:MAG: addiction module antitoxin RelB [Methylococcales bacterium]|nr:addiction module antitoxin RelB [Methylococcales bacterium]
MDFQLVEHEALNLSYEFRAELTQKLLLSLNEVTVTENKPLWLDEALHRSGALDQDDSQVRSTEAIFSFIKKIIHQ